MANENERKFRISIVNLKEYCFERDLDKFIPEKEEIKTIEYEKIFLEYFHEKESILKGFLNILAMIYFCLLLIAVTAAGVSMMFYACLKRQGYLITFMHVLWNVIRFFIFSYFLYGTAYGVFYDILSDLIGVMKMIYTYNLDEKSTAGKFLKGCLSLPYSTDSKDSPVVIFLDDRMKISVSDFFTFLDKKYNDDSNEQININDTICTDIENNKENYYCTHLNAAINLEKNFSYLDFDCSFLKSDLHHLYKTLNDASLESQKLAAISLCTAFFGEIAVYFYLLVIHHYNNELFFDSGKSIFTGFDGFGRGFKNKNKNNDPAYKKRKLRAEIELTSKNDEQNEYKDISKNDDD